MKLNISNLLKHNKDRIPFEISSNSSILERGDFNLYLKAPLKVVGEALYDGEIIRVKGEIFTEIEAQCSRCLTGFIQPIMIEFDEEFSRSQNDEDVYPINEDIIDLEDMVIDNIILSAPVQPLCSEECKGLCPTCGTNLNAASCNCDNEVIDPRFAALKDLFKR